MRIDSKLRNTADFVNHSNTSSQEPIIVPSVGEWNGMQ
jgi:hypothetical protein